MVVLRDGTPARATEPPPVVGVFGGDEVTAVDDALDRLEKFILYGESTKPMDALAAVSDALKQARDELAHLKSEYHFDMDRGDHLVYAREWDAFNAWQRGDLSFESRALAAEAKVRWLTQERDEAVEAYEAQAEFGGKQLAEVRRLTEGIREILGYLGPNDGYLTWSQQMVDRLARALLADSPPEGT